MDPDAALLKILKALDSKDRDDAVQGLEDLAGWLRSGGFFPDLDRALPFLEVLAMDQTTG